MTTNILSGLALLLVLTAFAPAQAEELLTRRSSVLLVTDSTRVNNNDEKMLATAVRGQAFNGVLKLPSKTLVKVTQRETFTRKETLYKRGDPMPKDVKRQFQIAFVEVLDGPNAGRTGWTVVSYQDPGERAQTFMAAAPRNYAQQQASNSNSSAARADSVDLVVDIYQGKISPTGGRLYEVGIVNKGGQTFKGSVEVLVTCNGDRVTTEKVRGPLAQNQATSFTVQMGDKEIREHQTLKVHLDPSNAIEESNKANNKAERRL